MAVYYRRSFTQALTNRLEYVWIDTICINKSSSAELSEAINSMFAWYQQAKLCYAYLSDVSSDCNTTTDALSKPDSDFCQSKWFTRGWTLQELLAPSTVRQTRIHVLRRQASPGSLSIAARMTWAANRQTTRKEDMAYCLMGIFDVKMTMLYGEGDRAFTRLQEEIIRTSDNESIFALGFNRDEAGGWSAQRNPTLRVARTLNCSPLTNKGRGLCWSFRRLSARCSCH
ncbi:heterokaryon incompatibility protein-domain-containing protein [Lasiosphaeris hirsuta]|uniref:Heterokaryon incompatibility protein-domain-containing protein n=1 Tax=Lasiosphaeris hirsuta TaxID=260670 RepID=A0AA40E7Z5_9PEZI|nr:heterokaryon incompatibility protein-domain-containing protein [Lasiosphaeris hirsuta]